jgi:hypothetical protein
MRIPSTNLNWRNAWQAGILLASMPVCAIAQLPSAKLDWVFPPGGQRGTKVDIAVGGADLDEGREFVFSHPKLVAKAKRTPADEFYPNGQPVANQFTVEIGADVPPGFYDAQLVGRHGLSTVRVFQVTDFAEVADNGNNHTIELAQALTLGQLVSGRTDAEQADFYSIELPEGEQFTCEIWSRRIDSQAEIQVEVCRSDGAPLKSQFRRERRDPQLSFAAPAAGKYLLRVQDVTFRGGEPFFYRMAVHRQPVVHSVMPPAALPNAESEFTLLGKHLNVPAGSNAGSSSEEQRIVKVPVPGTENPSGAVYPIAAEPRELDVERFAYRFADAGAATNDVWIGVATNPIVIQPPPSDTRPPAPRLSIPGEFVGQFSPKRNTEWIELQPDAAGEIVIEVFSQRMGEPTDPFLTVSQVVKSEQGEESLKQVVEADRGEERSATPGYNITSEDPYVKLNLEKDAVYRIMVRDQNSFSRGGQSHAYRVVVRRPQPDFRLLVSPASPWAADANIPLRWPLTVRAGDALTIPVVALRQDGFAGDIIVTAEGLPAGVHCDPVTIRAGKTAGQLVILTDENAAAWVGSIRVVGEGQVGDTRPRKVATPASLVWDTTTANFDRARLNQQLVLAVIQEPAPVSVRFDEAKWETTPGGVVKAKMTVSVRTEIKEALSLAPTGLPEGVTAKFTMAEDKKSAELELTVGEKTAPGIYDILVSGKPLALYRNNPEAAARASEDQARIAKLVEGFKSQREQMVAAAGAAADASSPEIKQLDDKIARGDAAIKEATERATKLTAAAQPAERRSYVVSNVGTLQVKEKPKE